MMSKNPQAEPGSMKGEDRLGNVSEDANCATIEAHSIIVS